jgi:hypothetical protein
MNTRYLAGTEDHYSNTRNGKVDLWRDGAPAFGENNTDYSNYVYVRTYYSKPCSGIFQHNRNLRITTSGPIPNAHHVLDECVAAGI